MELVCIFRTVVTVFAQKFLFWRLRDMVIFCRVHVVSFALKERNCSLHLVPESRGRSGRNAPARRAAGERSLSNLKRDQPIDWFVSPFTLFDIRFAFPAS